MTKHPERLSTLFRSPAQLKIACDILQSRLRDHPEWAREDQAEILAALEERRHDAEAMAAWCVEFLTAEQIRVLHKALRLAANQQRVYKRTVMLSPRAHLLMKTLAEQEALKMSDVIEQYLDGVLRERFGLAVRTRVNELDGQVEHDIVPIAETPPPNQSVLDNTHVPV